MTLKRFARKIRYRYKDLKEYPLVSVSKERVSVADDEEAYVIPSTVYQTWEDNLFGRTHAVQLEKFRAINPSLDFFIYDKNDIFGFMEEFYGDHEIFDIFNRTKYGPMKADIFRYCVLYEHGGYYFDISKGCSVPLRSLHGRSDAALISFERNVQYILGGLSTMSKLSNNFNYILQWGLGFVKGHPVLRTVIDNICEYYPFFRGKRFENPKVAILALTGPGMFTKSVRDVMEVDSSIRVAQAGIDFYGNGITSMPGSYIRYRTTGAYSDAKDSIIVD